MKPLVVIPARGGSKGIPRKNVKLLNGKPLIAYTLEVALATFEKDVICVSTDDEEVKSITEGYGLPVPFMRPANLANDTAGMRQVLQHALRYYDNQGYKADCVVLLQPTSPFRKKKHIEEVLAIYHPRLDRVVSVKETTANPYYLLLEENEQGYLLSSKEGNFTRRQDCPEVWEINGAVYAINANNLRSNTAQYPKTAKYVMDEYTSLDIDTPLDWNIAECLMAKSNALD